MAQELVESPPSDEVKPYRIHVHQKYVELTRKKLELTRLPHEVSQPKSKDWWEPKPQVEPLIDYWLEKHSWKDVELRLNSTIPQFRTAFHIATQDAPIRLHFVHARSSHENAIPVLLIPAFPFSSLSFGHLIRLFTAPENPAENQPFHLVIPSYPGLAFSDVLPNNTPVISTIAEVFNSLMIRLGYEHYLTSNAGPSAASPAQIDFKLADFLATNYSSSCLGTHLISPPLTSPRLPEDAWEWTKWSIALLFRAGILGYEKADFSALERSEAAPHLQRGKKKALTPAECGLDEFGACREPNTLAYALCDSPIGLLVFMLKNLRVLGPNKKFTEDEIITFTELAWLPGPEAGMRLWASVVWHGDKDITSPTTTTKSASKPVVVITVFLGEKGDAQPDGEESIPLDLLPTPAGNTYACPAWGNAKYDVVHAGRVSGKPGLLAWERPDVIVDGVRCLVRKVLERNPKLNPKKDKTVPLDGVVVTSSGKQVSMTDVREVTQAEAKKEQASQVKKEGGPTTPTGETSKHLEQDPEATPRPNKGKEVEKRPETTETSKEGKDATLGDGEGTKDGGEDDEAKRKDKGKEKEVTSPPDDAFLSGESPHTIVKGPIQPK